MRSPFIHPLRRRWRRDRQQQQHGFTLLELLVAILIGGIITSGLLFLVIELLTVNTREESLTETQQNMKRAIDYIGRDLGEAVFVYSDFTTTYDLMAQLDDEPAGTPVLAFWRLDPLTNDEVDEIASCTTADCTRLLTRQAYYTLVVYFHQDNGAGDIWEGPSRIVRYELPNFKGISSDDLAAETTTGYADPTLTLVGDADSFNSFENWQKGSGNTDGNANVLTDYVNVRDSNVAPPCPAEYARSPAAGDAFYICVQQPDNANVPGVNKSVLLYLQGNASKGAADDVVGVSEASSLPTLESEVLIRGVIQSNPAAEN